MNRIVFSFLLAASVSSGAVFAGGDEDVAGSCPHPSATPEGVHEVMEDVVSASMVPVVPGFVNIDPLVADFDAFPFNHDEVALALITAEEAEAEESTWDSRLKEDFKISFVPPAFRSEYFWNCCLVGKVKLNRLSRPIMHYVATEYPLPAGILREDKVNKHALSAWRRQVVQKYCQLQLDPESYLFHHPDVKRKLKNALRILRISESHSNFVEKRDSMLLNAVISFLQPEAYDQEISRARVLKDGFDRGERKWPSTLRRDSVVDSEVWVPDLTSVEMRPCGPVRAHFMKMQINAVLDRNPELKEEFIREYTSHGLSEGCGLKDGRLIGGFWPVVRAAFVMDKMFKSITGEGPGYSWDTRLPKGYDWRDEIIANPKLIDDYLKDYARWDGSLIIAGLHPDGSFSTRLSYRVAGHLQNRKAREIVREIAASRSHVES